MRAFVAVTDEDWYRYLAARPELTEVNFWRPGGRGRFQALAVGEPFFFKTHHPHNRVVGGGFYSGFATSPISEAWELFGPANGVTDLDQMRRRVGHYVAARLPAAAVGPALPAHDLLRVRRRRAPRRDGRARCPSRTRGSR